MKKYVLIYGFSLALLLFMLKWMEYHYLIRSLHEEIYIGLLALFFTLLGIWAGVKWMKIHSVKINAADKNASELHPTLNLSEREMEVLQGIENGLSNKEIGKQLFLSESTIKTHAANLYTKLNVNRRTQAVHAARQLGLIS